METGDNFTQGVYDNLLSYEAKRRGIEFRTEGEYAAQIRCLCDSISPRRDPFQGEYINASEDGFGSWVIATTSKFADEEPDIVQIFRVNPQSRILIAHEPDSSGLKNAIEDADLSKDRKFVYFHAPSQTPGDNIRKYNEVESLIGRLQRALLKDQAKKEGLEKLDEETTEESLARIIESIKKTCDKYPDAMRGFSFFLGHKGSKKEILAALKEAGLMGNARARVLSHFTISDIGLEGGYKIKQDGQLGNYSLKFQPEKKG